MRRGALILQIPRPPRLPPRTHQQQHRLQHTSQVDRFLLGECGSREQRSLQVRGGEGGVRHCLQTVAEGSSGRLQRPRAATVIGGMRSVSEQRSNLLLLPPCPTSAETATPSPPPLFLLPPCPTSAETAPLTVAATSVGAASSDASGGEGRVAGGAPGERPSNLGSCEANPISLEGRGGDWGGKDGGRLHNTASPAVLRPLDAILIWPAPPPLPA